MNLSYDGEPEIHHSRCTQCDAEHETSTGFVLRDGSVYAVYWANWYPHSEETYVDMTIGSWNEPDYEDHVTFGCRIGNIEGLLGPKCSLVQGGSVRSDLPILGEKLSREAALEHPWVQEFWQCIDWLCANDPILHEHVFHA